MTRLLLLCSLLLPVFTNAQPLARYTVKHIDQRNGLLHNTVYAITQDKKGFIWVATDNGLQRYDGLRFENFNKGLEPIINTGVIKYIYPDDHNNLWLAGDRLARLNLATHQATLFSTEEIAGRPLFNQVDYSDSAKRTWRMTDFGLFFPGEINDPLKPLSIFTPHQQTVLGHNVYADPQRQCVWVPTWAGLMMFDQASKQIYTPSFNPQGNKVLKALRGQTISALFVDRNDNIWASTWERRLFYFDAKTQRLKQYFLGMKRKVKTSSKGVPETGTAVCIFQDSHGTVWVGTDFTGLLHYNSTDDAFEQAPLQNNESSTLQPYSKILCMNEDREGNLWIGTEKGLCIFNPYRQFFQRIAHEENRLSSLPPFEITSAFRASNGSLYIATWGGGFSIYDSLLSFKKTIKPTGDRDFALTWSFAEGDDKIIWVGAQHGTLHLYNPGTGQVKTIVPSQMDKSTIRSIVKDEEGNLWFALHSGNIVEWEKASGLFKKCATPVFALKVPLKKIYAGYGQDLWCSTDSGLLRFNKAEHRFTNIYRLTGDACCSNCSNEIHGIEQASKRSFYIGTAHCGVFLFDTEIGKYSRLKSLSALDRTSIYALKKDEHQNLWISTDYHLYQLEAVTGKLIKYAFDAGLLTGSFAQYDFLSLQNGQWLSSTPAEVVLFTPSLLKEDKAVKKVLITNFHTADQPLVVDSMLASGQPVRLQSSQNFITIEFTTNTYSNVQEQSFFYRLKGVDKEWVKGDVNGVATYTNLTPGDYLFSVRADDKTNADSEAQVKIIITPPFYLTWWFKTLLILLVVLTTYLIISRRIKSIRYEADLKRKIAETEMAALRSQMNPHFIFNCLGAIDNLMQTGQADKATTYLSRFAKLIRSVLESSKSNLVPFYKDFETLKLYVELEQFRSGNKFSFCLAADEELLNGDYKVPPLIVQPFVENAIQHGLFNKLEGERRITIKAVLNGSAIQYIVSDNGVGRAKAVEIKERNKPGQKAYGIEITTERIRMHNRVKDNDDILISDVHNDEGDTGTEVVVNLKIANS
ncbi:ligand-binding sensor domain-containing protein [Flavisolibacter ginsenosidimutans]|uniref:Signal transduction histidine kinase internal region domain-containing protein n=1 Tax=Flavisolibacter ginsenosidimutans TaxID=661481 RepID=A0A5B8UD20_9BACT|nr:sensor histidine kinase [Flavisolibacter ginsenosidimutans]QEC54577.1 hypothetical protein FSB75_01235 [Flavisolibacter ginsenosidimutans]